MGKITDKIRKNADGKFFSFEFFPPKTEAGVQNLYLRMDRMISMQPLFIDLTWGAGGCTKDLSIGICEYAQNYFGTDALLHVTCTDMTVEEMKVVLKTAKDVGIQNILALRGDPSKGAPSWKPLPGGLNSAKDLVELIREEHGDYFCIGVAGFPEGHPNSKPEQDASEEICFLKQKIEAGADFILTQFFYDSSVFIEYMTACRSAGIMCPIMPGIMPLQSHSSFQKMTTFCRTRVPEKIWADLEPIKNDDEAVKTYGVKLCVEMCNALLKHGIRFFHFYTLNLERSVMAVLKELSFCGTVASRR